MAKEISITEMARWIAEMAGADGEITPNERKLMKRFADTYGLDFGKLIRMAYAISGKNEQEVELIKPSEIKGLQFEEFVVSLLSDKSLFRLLAWRSDKIVDGIYAAENLLPDLEIKQRINYIDVDYFVECKYRASWETFLMSDLSKQIGRYRFFAKEHGKRLFIALGIGGTPHAPEAFYVIPSHAFNRMQDDPSIQVKSYRCKPTTEAFQKRIARYFKNLLKSNQQNHSDKPARYK